MAQHKILILRRDGTITFRLDENVKAFLRELARQEGKGLSSYIENVLEKHIDDLAPAKKQQVLEALVRRSPESEPDEGQPTFSTLMKQAKLGDLLSDLEQAQPQGAIKKRQRWTGKPPDINRWTGKPPHIKKG
jgi:hypothetical protein